MTAQEALILVRDPMWQFVGAALALLAIAVTVWIFYRQLARKSLAFGIAVEYPLMSMTEQLGEMHERLQVEFDGVAVKKLWLVVFDLKNNGNVPIEATDFASPIRVDFGQECRLLSATIIDQRPRDLGARVRQNGNAVELDPLLLNAGDMLSVKALADGQSPKVNAAARIVGISKIGDLKARADPLDRQMYLSVFLLFGVVIGVAFALVSAAMLTLAWDPLTTLFASFGVIVVSGIASWLTLTLRLRWPR